MSLLEEINSYGATQQENSLGDEALAADPLPGDPLNSPDADSNLLHTNVDKQSPEENDSQQITEESEKS
jgi:deferrochelatase/peroxidase EfeB